MARTYSLPWSPGAAFQQTLQGMALRSPDGKRSRWVFHVSLLVVVCAIPTLFFYSHGFWSAQMLKQAMLTVACIVPFYAFHLAYLVPALMLHRGRYGTYFLTLIPTYGVFWLLVKGMAYLLSLTEMPNLPFGRPIENQTFPGGGILFPYLIIFAIGIMFEVVMESERRKRREVQARKEKTQTELAFLKAQINPHFLFNSLNTIYGLALTKDDQTEEAVVLLSDLMRYMLYESDTDQMPLTREVEFLEKYIALHRMRLSTKKNISIQFHVEGCVESVKVEPLLLAPFVENAFKHGISYREESWVRIHLSVTRDRVVFAVENSRHPGGKKVESSGIGLANTKQRLQMLYPNRHTLHIAEGHTVYSTSLTLDTRL